MNFGLRTYTVNTEQRRKFYARCTPYDRIFYQSLTDRRKLYATLRTYSIAPRHFDLINSAAAGGQTGTGHTHVNVVILQQPFTHSQARLSFDRGRLFVRSCDF
jgi:hypothetical protein